MLSPASQAWSCSSSRCYVQISPFGSDGDADAIREAVRALIIPVVLAVLGIVMEKNCLNACPYRNSQ